MKLRARSEKHGWITGVNVNYANFSGGDIDLIPPG
jgi:hypothetical protein